MGKEEVELSLLTHDTVMYTENPRESSKKLLELISGFSKVDIQNTN